MADVRPVSAVITVIIVITSLYAGLIVFDGLPEPENDDAVARDDTVHLSGTGTWVQVNDGEGHSETVYDSRGYALQFHGTDDSYLTSTRSVNVSSDGNWTVSQPVLDIQNRHQDQILLSIGDPTLILQYLNNSSGTDQWSAVYYTSTDSYRVNVSAPDPTNTTHLYVVRDGSTLTIHRNSTQGDSADLSTSNAIGGDLTTASNCKCTLDETRTFDTNLSSSERQQLRNDPVAPLTSAPRTARIMYDAGEGSDVNIYWSSADAEASNVTWVQGFDGNELDRDGLVTSGDYEWDRDGPQLKPVSGGRLDGAPAAFVEYTFLPKWAQDRVLEAVEAAYGLASLLPLAILVSVIVGLFLRLRAA